MTTNSPRSRWGRLQGLAARLVGTPAADESVKLGTARCLVLRPGTAKDSWDALVASGAGTWLGGQSSASRMAIRLVEAGDEVLLLNNDRRRALVGIARVTRAAYPAPTHDEPSRLAIDMEPIARIAPVILLSKLRGDSQLGDCAMLRSPTPEIVRLAPGERRVLKRHGVS